MARTLTPKQEAFAQAYVANGGKKQQSALDAGYAQESAAVEAQRFIGSFWTPPCRTSFEHVCPIS